MLFSKYLILVLAAAFVGSSVTAQTKKKTKKKKFLIFGVRKKTPPLVMAEAFIGSNPLW